MKKTFALLTSLLVFLLIYSPAKAQVLGEGGWRVGEKQIRISADHPEYARQLYNLKLNLDFYGPDYDYFIVYVTPDELKQIEALGIPYTVEIEDLNQYSINSRPVLAAYHSYQEIIDLADSLVTHFPSICNKYLYGYSVEGRQLAALKISDNVSIDEPEPEILFDGGIHGDEIGGSENIIRFARDLCLKYGSDPAVTDLINNREIWLYLMVNPDGRHHNTRYNANGVDLNRDWAYMWDAWGGSPGPCSQVESKALRKCMYNNQFVIHITYHSGTEFISLPWSYRSSQPFDWNHIYQLGGLYSSVSGYANLTYGQGNSGMYPINGSTKDSNYGIMGSVSWTMEISNSKQPPASQIMQYYNWNYPSMIAMIEYAGYGLEGTVTDSITGDPVAAAIFVNDYFPSYSDPAVGDYHKYVLPGTYSITVVANGYHSKTVENVVVTANNATTTDFQLKPAGGQFVYKFPASQIEGNNEADEGLTPAVIGPPDSIYYSLGKNGWCVLDMQFPISDGPGPDFIVREGDDSPEGFTCYVGETIDGPWLSVGSGNGTSEFDIMVSGLTEAQFIKIVDDGDGTAIAPDAGFDLDAIIEFLAPNPPEEFSAYSDYTTPTSMLLTWTDPTHLTNGDPLDPADFAVLIWRDEALVDSVPGGTASYIDNGLNDGQAYNYKMAVKADSIGRLSDFISTVWIAGGSPVPDAPTSFSVAGSQNEVTLSWVNPSANLDGTPMDDFAGINLYQNGVLTTTFTRASSDTGAADSETYVVPNPGFYDWFITAVDNETPQNESDPTPALGTPLSLPLNEDFNTAGAPNPGLWLNIDTDVNDRAYNPPSGPYSLNLNGYPNGEDIIDLKPVDMSGAQGSNILVSYWYQPQGTGNQPQPGDSLRVYFKNDLDDWILVMSYPGMALQPFQEEIIDIASAPNGGGSYFHGQFQVRFRSTGSSGIFINDDWFIDNVFLGASVGIETPLTIPLEYAVKQNYPNPFNPETTIEYQLPRRSEVSLVIYNTLGQKVRTVLDQTLEAGFFKAVWDGRDENNLPVASGVYIYVMKAGKFKQSRKMLLVK